MVMLLPVSKKDAVSAFLQTTDIQLLLDARCEGVVVPAQFSASKKLALHLGLDTTIPIPDLAVDEKGIAATLSFNKTPFKCEIPWKAIYAIVLLDSGRCLLFQQDVPADVEVDFVRDDNEDKEKRLAPKIKPKLRKAAEVKKLKKPTLQIVDGGKKQAGPPANAQDVQYLKIVK